MELNLYALLTDCQLFFVSLAVSDQLPLAALELLSRSHAVL
jgi:hypothetical protein